jgi:hypothetical protein
MVESGRNPWKMIALQRLSVAEPLENIGQPVRLNLAEAQGAIPANPHARLGGQSMGISVNEPLTTSTRYRVC